MVNAEKNWVKNLIAKVIKKAKDDKTFASYEDYSTEEKCIGKWINGKPLYRGSVICTSNGEVTKWNTLCANTINAETTINAFGIDSNGTFLDSWTKTDANNIYYFMTNAAYASGMRIYLEYTKSTDAENSFTTSMLN